MEVTYIHHRTANQRSEPNAQECVLYLQECDDISRGPETDIRRLLGMSTRTRLLTRPTYLPSSKFCPVYDRRDKLLESGQLIATKQGYRIFDIHLKLLVESFMEVFELAAQ